MGGIGCKSAMEALNWHKVASRVVYWSNWKSETTDFFLNFILKSNELKYAIDTHLAMKQK